MYVLPNSSKFTIVKQKQLKLGEIVIVGVGEGNIVFSDILKFSPGIGGFTTTLEKTFVLSKILKSYCGKVTVVLPVIEPALIVTPVFITIGLPDITPKVSVKLTVTLVFNLRFVLKE